jgi:hypothetical protein
MTVSLTGTSGLFTRLGRFGDLYLNTVTGYGSALDTAIEDIRDEFEAGGQGIVIDSLYTARNAYRGVHSGFLGTLQTMMQQTVIEQVNDDTALVSKTLANALTELLRQMTASSDTVLRPTTSGTITAYSGNKGDAKVLASFTNQYGATLDMVYPETIKLTCTSDTTNFQEVFSYAGQPKRAVTDKDWPGGSSCAGTLTLSNSATDNILSNGNFSTWTVAASAPSSWTYITGVGGTTLVRDTTVKRTSAGGYSLQFVGDSSTAHEIKQQLSSSLLRANQVLCFQGWGKMSAADANAVLRVRLVDSTGAVINNDAATANSATFDCNSTIGTSYTSISTFFQLPRQLPSGGVFLHISISSGNIDTGKTLNLSLLSVVEATQLYSQGPFMAGFSAALPHAAGDYFYNVVANDAPNAGWIRAGQRWLGMDTLGSSYYFTSVASSETIANSLLA